MDQSPAGVPSGWIFFLQLVFSKVGVFLTSTGGCGPWPGAAGPDGDLCLGPPTNDQQRPALCRQEKPSRRGLPVLGWKKAMGTLQAMMKGAARTRNFLLMETLVFVKHPYEEFFVQSMSGGGLTGGKAGGAKEKSH